MLHVKKLLGPAAALTVTSCALASQGEGVAPAAETIFHIGPLPITNSMVTSWIIAVGLVIAIRIAVRTPKLVPSRGQAMVESIVEGILDLIQPIVGTKTYKAAFPLLVSLFVFILIQNWSGLIPGIGTIFTRNSAGHWVEIFRPGNADMNGTVALAVVAMACWGYLIFRYAGPKAVLYDIFGNKADKRDVPAFIYYLLFPIFFAVGLLEIVSIAFRPVSLSFRLYGNIFGGENLLHAMSSISKWGLPIPFYFMELLVGFVQAFVFTLLVTVYIGLICNHGDDHSEETSPSHH
jgi:F-type H+-transporting ATPase subunit a